MHPVRTTPPTSNLTSGTQCKDLLRCRAVSEPKLSLSSGTMHGGTKRDLQNTVGVLIKKIGCVKCSYYLIILTTNGLLGCNSTASQGTMLHNMNCTHMWTRAYMHTYILTSYIHTYLYTHTHVCVCTYMLRGSSWSQRICPKVYEWERKYEGEKAGVTVSVPIRPHCIASSSVSFNPFFNKSNTLLLRVFRLTESKMKTSPLILPPRETFNCLLLSLIQAWMLFPLIASWL